MLNKNLTGFAQSLFSVQSVCTVRKGSASRVELVENFRSAKEKEDEYEFCPREAWYFVFDHVICCFRLKATGFALLW